MKKIILASLLLTSASFAQTKQTLEKNDRGFIGVSIGASKPLGNYGDTDIDNNSAGLAEQGYVTDLNVGYNLGKHFGVLILVRYQENGVNATSIAKQLHNESPSWAWTVKTQGWKTLATMAGGYGSFQLGRSKVLMDIKGAVGFVSVTSPQITINGSDGSSNISSKMYSQSAGSFAYMLGIDYRWNFSKVVGLMVNIDYLGSNPEFQKVKTVTSGSAPTYDTYNQSLATMNYTFGVVFRLK